MADNSQAQEARVQAKIAEIKQGYSAGIVDLLKEMNTGHLRDAGEVTATPVIERMNMRWTLAWKEKEKISFDLSVVVTIEDDGKEARVGRVFVHRHASTPLDYEDHTPTTRMRRLASLSIKDIRDVVEAEMQ